MEGYLFFVARTVFLLSCLQVRTVNQQQVMALVDSFTKNVPDQLTLTVNPERSVLPRGVGMV